jgi:hypothetical protein
LQFYEKIGRFREKKKYQLDLLPLSNRVAAKFQILAESNRILKEYALVHTSSTANDIEVQFEALFGDFFYYPAFITEDVNTANQQR